MGVAFMALIIFAPLFYEGVKKLRDLFKKDDKAALISDHVLAASAARPILCGLLLGACAFWNGAMVMGQRGPWSSWHCSMTAAMARPTPMP